MDTDQYTADRFCDLNKEITDRFFQAPQRIKVKTGEISRQTLSPTIPNHLSTLCNHLQFNVAAVSSKYIVLVAKSGSLYIYTRDPLNFLLLIPINRKIGSIERITVSPNNNYVVITNHRAELYLQNISSVDGHLSDLSAYNKSLPDVKYLGTAKANITCFWWSADEKQLYYGDRGGNVCLISVDSFFNGNIFNANIHPILLLDQEIVQIDGFDLLMIVSTRTGCILCNTDREEFKQIGNRPRDGQYGACFMNKSIDEFLRGWVICARPGARFWQVDYGGTVKQTIQFKDALNKPPLRPTSNNLGTTDDGSAEPPKKYSNQNLSFAKLIELHVDEEHFLVAFTRAAVYVLDPLNSKLILWTDYYANICDVFVVNNSVYCISECPQDGGISVGSFQVRHKMHAFEGRLMAGDHEETMRFITEHKRYLKSKTVMVRESLRPRMEQTKEFLIREQEYECLEIISHIDYSAERKSSSDQQQQQSNVTILTVRRDPMQDKSPRTMIASALRTTFNLFNQATGRGHSPELIRANATTTGTGTELALRTSPPRLDLFREITTNFTSGPAIAGDAEVIVDNKKKFFTNRKFKKLSELLKTNENEEGDGVKETKALKNIFLIFKSSRIANVSMVDRYAPILEKLTLPETLDMMRKLEALMQENDYSELEAKQNSTIVLLDYLNPSVINEEIDNETLEELIDRYVLVNQTKEQAKGCVTCAFPLEILDECLYYDFGRTLFEFLYAREDVANYQRLMKNIPHLLHTFAKYYREASPRESYLQLLFILRKFSAANPLGGSDWSYLLDLSCSIQTEQLVKCFNCGKWSSVARVPFELPEEYSWNFMLNQAARFMGGPGLLREVLKHSNAIKSGELSKQFFLKCMQTA